MATLDELVEQVQTALDSDRNRARRERRGGPAVYVGIEDPIAWVTLFGYDPQRYFTDPEFNFAQQLRQKLWKFAHIDDDQPLTLDLPAWLGHYPEYTFYGLHVAVRPHGGPELQTDHPLTRSPDLSLLPPVEFGVSGWMPRMWRWYDRLVELSAGRVPIHFFGWNRGGLDLAVQLRGYENLLLDCLERPEFVHGLLGQLTEDRCRWHTAAADYLGTKVGATWVADDWVAVPYISPSIFRDFVLPRYLELEAFHGVFAGFHSCGNQAPLHADMLTIRTLGSFEVSPWMDLAEAMANLPPDKHLNVTAHPNDVVVDQPEAMAAKLRAKAALLKDSGRPYTVSTAGLTPLHGEADFVRRANHWVAAAREAFA